VTAPVDGAPALDELPPPSTAPDEPGPPSATAPDETGAAADDPSPSLSDLLLAGFILIEMVAFFGSQLADGDVVVRITLAWIAGGLGVVVLARRIWRRDAASMWAGGFVAWSFLCLLLSGNPTQSFSRGIGLDNGWSYLAAYFGCWVVGRAARPTGRRLMTGSFLLGASVSALVAVLQIATKSESGILAWTFGRPFGLQGNPVLFGAVMSGAAAFCAALLARAADDRWWRWLFPVGVFAAAANLSGSRAALAGALVISVLAVRRAGLRRTGAVVAVVLVAYAATWNAIPDGAGKRLGSSTGSGLTARTEMWKASVHAIEHEPIVGWGPGRYSIATGRWVTPAFVRSEEDRSEYEDAHDVVFDLATSTGLVGLALAAGFAWTASRRTRGPWKWLAAGAAVTWFLEPVSIFVAPVAMLALGLAGADGDLERAAASGDPAGEAAAGDAGVIEPSPGPRPDPLPRPALALALALMVVGMVAGGRLLLADVYRSSGLNNNNVDDLERAQDILPHDVGIGIDIALYRNQVAEITHRSSDAQAAVQAWQHVVDLDPERHTNWIGLAGAQYAAVPAPTRANNELVRKDLERAWELRPWFTTTIRASYRLALADGRTREAAVWRRRLCQVTTC
jgi:O-antigen ligase